MSGATGSKTGAIVAGAIGAFVTWRGARTLAYGLHYDHIIPAAVITLAIGLALLAWAFWTWRGRATPTHAPVERRAAPSARAAAPTGPAVTDRGIDHPYLRLELPPGWRRAQGPEEMFAIFERQRSEMDHAMLNVILGHGPPGTDGRKVLQSLMDVHAHSLAENYPRRMDPQPVEESVDSVVMQIVRTYLCQADGPEWLVTARYAMTTEPIAAPGLPVAKPLIQITCYEQAWGGGDVGAIVRGAVIAPTARASSKGTDAGTLRPGDGVSAAGDVITVRKLELAMRFPIEMPDRGTRAEDSATCPDCSAAMNPVLITTGGDFGDRAVWEARPVAVDGWRCPRCEALTYPRVLGPERITTLVNEGIGHAQAGRLDDAEIALRRAASSWPGYPPPRMNLGAVYLDRIRAERAGANRADVVERYVNEAERQLRIALANDKQPTFQLLFMLGRLLITRGRRDEGAPLLDRVLRDPQTPNGLRAEAQRLLQ